MQAITNKKNKMKNVRAAIDHFVNNEENGEAWRNILLWAPPRARARIGISMYYSFYKHNMFYEEREEYRQARKWIEDILDVEDLRYLFKVMPEKQKGYYAAMLIEKRGSEDGTALSEMS